MKDEARITLQEKLEELRRIEKEAVIPNPEYVALLDAVEALRKIGSYFDCEDCEFPNGLVCERHLEERMNIARTALDKVKKAMNCE